MRRLLAGLRRNLALTVLLAACCTGVAIASPKTNPCELITRADASKALGVPARPGIAYSASATPNGPKIGCVYFSPVGVVRVGFQTGGRAAYDASRKNAQPGETDLSGIGDAAYFIHSSIIAIKGTFMYVVTLTFQGQGEPPSADHRLTTLAKKAASRL
ncbi:MAG TPA: hypothetical protein VNJ51_00485 [Candidatus Dormibacteraeota bacterium]|nr:hypothetical protein [Candidatus Dormibacteraeota bacterium]